MFDDVQSPEDYFSRISRGSSEIVDFGYVDIFLQVSGDPPVSIKIVILTIFENFQWIWVFIECAGPAQCNVWIPFFRDPLQSLM